MTGHKATALPLRQGSPSFLKKGSPMHVAPACAWSYVNQLIISQSVDEGIGLVHTDSRNNCLHGHHLSQK
jgi:hypothetical protein